MTKPAIVTQKNSLSARLSRHWSTKDLVTIGVFSAISKATTVLVAFVGGGMNPLSLAMKNALFVTLLAVLLAKVPRFGTLTLTALINALISLFLLGQGMLNLPALFVSCLLAEALIWLLGGYKKMGALLSGIIFSEIFSKAASLVVLYFTMREQTGMVIGISMLIGLGSIGCFIGLYTGYRFIKELRHAGIITA